MDAELRTKFEMYIADDAERWTAVHARISALSFALYAATIPLAKDPQAARAVIEMLRMAAQDRPGEPAPHPAFVAEVERLVRDLGEVLKPHPV